MWPNRDPLDLVKRNPFLSLVIKVGHARTFVVGDVLRDFQLAAVLQVRGDAGRAEGQLADFARPAPRRQLPNGIE